jgi:hypothetical protein
MSWRCNFGVRDDKSSAVDEPVGNAEATSMRAERGRSTMFYVIRRSSLGHTERSAGSTGAYFSSILSNSGVKGEPLYL